MGTLNGWRVPYLFYSLAPHLSRVGAPLTFILPLPGCDAASRCVAFCTLTPEDAAKVLADEQWEIAADWPGAYRGYMEL